MSSILAVIVLHTIAMKHGGSQTNGSLRTHTFFEAGCTLFMDFSLMLKEGKHRK